MVICGSDSHTCSAGALGTFAVGLGAADVVMPLVTGETWFCVPETIKIVYKGEPRFGIGGKGGALKFLNILLDLAWLGFFFFFFQNNVF